MRTEAPSPDVRIADRPCGLHRRFGYRRFLVSPVRPIAGFVLEALSPEFPSPEPHIAGRSIAGRFLMCYRRVSKSGDEIRRYQAASAVFGVALLSASAEGFPVLACGDDGIMRAAADYKESRRFCGAAVWLVL